MQLAQSSLHAARFAAALVVLLAAGCANQFASSYRPAPNAAATAFAPYSGQTQIVDSVQVRVDVAHWEALGYGVIGVSSFVDTTEGTAQVRGSLLAQASKIGADIVITKAKADGSEIVSLGYDDYFAKDSPMGGDHRGAVAATEHATGVGGTFALTQDKYVAVYLRKMAVPSSPS